MTELRQVINMLKARRGVMSPEAALFQRQLLRLLAADEPLSAEQMATVSGQPVELIRDRPVIGKPAILSVPKFRTVTICPDALSSGLWAVVSTSRGNRKFGCNRVDRPIDKNAYAN